METVNFSYTQLTNLFEACPLKKAGKVIYREVSADVQSYIRKYFFQTIQDNYYFWDADEQTFMISSKEAFKNVYFNKMPREVQHWYFNENINTYKTIVDPKRPVVDGSTINLFGGFKHSIKAYSTFSAEIKNKVNIYLSYLREVISNNDEHVYKYILKWTSNMVRGNKNNSLLYLKGVEGIGKSTFTEFLRKHVLGDKISIQSSEDPLKSPYNKILCGKLLVIFEELPTFNDKEWEGVSSKLKKMVTEDSLTYSDKYEKQFSTANINNYIINTNVEALKHSEGRRYFLVPVSTARKGDHAYFGVINDQCFNDQVGHAFYNYLLEIDISNFNCQRDMPETQNKNDAIVERLDPVYQFLKHKYILKQASIYCTVQELHDKYSSFCSEVTKKALTKIGFCKKLSEIQINYYKSNGRNMFKVTYEELKTISDKGKWIHALDECEVESESSNLVEPLENGIESPNEMEKLKQENNDLKQQVQDLQKLLEQMEMMLHKKQNDKPQKDEPENDKPKKVKSKPTQQPAKNIADDVLSLF